MEGMDVSISITNCSPRFDDIGFWYGLLRELPGVVGLKKMDPPTLYRFPTEIAPDDLGVSGTMLMVQSHCAFHWWPTTNFCHITVSSCVKFDVTMVVHYVGEHFRTGDFSVRESWW